MSMKSIDERKQCYVDVMYTFCSETLLGVLGWIYFKHSVVW